MRSPAIEVESAAGSERFVKIQFTKPSVRFHERENSSTNKTGFCVTALKNFQDSSTIPETNIDSSHLKTDGWNIYSFPFGARPIFSGELAVSFRECIHLDFHLRIPFIWPKYFTHLDFC